MCAGRAAEIAAAEIVAHLVRLRAVGLPRDPHRVADRLDPRPVLRRSEVTRRLREIIRPLVDPTVPVVERLVIAVPQVFQVAFQVIEEIRLDRSPELRLVVLDGDDTVAAAGDDLLDDLLLDAVRLTL